MKLPLTLAAVLGIAGALHAQRPNIVRPTFERPVTSLGSFLPETSSTADEQEPREIGTPEPAPTDSAPTKSGKADSDIESKPLGKLTATPTGTAKPLVPEKLIPQVATNLVLVVGLMVVGAFGWKALKRGPRRAKGPAVESESGLPTRLEIEDQIRLTGGQTLYSVRHGGRAFLIGSTPQNVTLLADLSAQPTKPALSVAPVAAPAEPRRPKPVVETPAPEPAEENAERFNGILDRLRAQESAGAIASALTEPIAETPAPARRRSLFDGGRG